VIEEDRVRRPMIAASGSASARMIPAICRQVPVTLSSDCGGCLDDQLADLVEAVKATLSTPVGRHRRASLTEAGQDVTNGGKPASRSVREDEGRSSGFARGFQHHVQPAASAGAIFQHAISRGKFHGMICATTPTGSFIV